MIIITDSKTRYIQKCRSSTLQESPLNKKMKTRIIYLSLWKRWSTKSTKNSKTSKNISPMFLKDSKQTSLHNNRKTYDFEIIVIIESFLIDELFDEKGIFFNILDWDHMCMIFPNYKIFEMLTSLSDAFKRYDFVLFTVDR